MLHYVVEIAKINMGLLVNYTKKQKKEIWLALSAFLLGMLVFTINYPGMGIAVFIGGVFFILLIINIELGLYLMVFFLPVIHWNFYFDSLEIPFIDLLAIVVVLAFFLRKIIFLLFGNNNDTRLDIGWPFFVPWLFFFSATILSALMSDNALAGAWYSLRWILLFYLAYILLPVNLIKNRKVLKNVLLVFVLSAVLIGVLGSISLISQDWHNEFVRIKPIAIAGIYPLGANQNLLVEVFLPAIFFVLALKKLVEFERQKKMLNLAFIFLVAVLIGTFSRGGWLALLICLLIYVLVLYRERVRYFLAPIIIVLAVLAPIFLYMYKMQTAYSVGISSTENRLLMNKITWQAFREKPFFGQGTGEYINLVDDNVRFKAKYGAPLDSHGIGQKVMAENGLFGLYGFMILIGSISIFLWQSFKKCWKSRWILLPIVMSALSIFIFEIFNTSYYKGKMWLPIAIAIAAVYLAKENKLSYAKD